MLTFPAVSLVVGAACVAEVATTAVGMELEVDITDEEAAEPCPSDSTPGTGWPVHPSPGRATSKAYTSSAKYLKVALFLTAS